MDYDSLAAVYTRHRHIHPGVLAELVALVPPPPVQRILEVGCGTGSYIAAIYSRLGYPCSGIDPSAVMLGHAGKVAPMVDLRLGRAESLMTMFHPESFDLIFSVDVIHHVSDRAAYLRGAYRLLRPGGVICTVTDSEWIIRNRQPQSVYFTETIEIELARYPRIYALKAMMTVAGFGDIGERLVESKESMSDIGPFREKAFSSLHLIPEEAYKEGIRKMEEDLKKGPIPYIRRYVIIHGIR